MTSIKVEACVTCEGSGTLPWNDITERRCPQCAGTGQSINDVGVQVLWNYLIGYMTDRTIKFMVKDAEEALEYEWCFEEYEPGRKLELLLAGLRARVGPWEKTDEEPEEEEDEHEIGDFHDGQDAFNTMMDKKNLGWAAEADEDRRKRNRDAVGRNAHSKWEGA